MNESGTTAVRDLWSSADILFTSRVTYVEGRSALARATRDGRIAAADRGATVNELDERWRELLLVGVTDALVRAAGDLAENRALRGYDAIHLASALSLDEEVLLATWDRELSEAASQEGLAVLGAS